MRYIGHNNQEAIDAGESLRSSGQMLSLEVAQATEAAQQDQLRKEADTIRTAISQMTFTVEARQRTGLVIQNVVEALRESSSELAHRELERLGPLLQRLYATIDPHPVFRRASFSTQIIRGHGQLSTVIEDAFGTFKTDEPSQVMSSSQLNALAIAVFLALNLGTRHSTLGLAMLDDPLQSLDDINLLGMVDLLRRARRRRQLFVSTHDRKFADLLERKLRPVRDDENTLIVEFDGWSQDGPVIEQRSVTPDLKPLRLVG